MGRSCSMHGGDWQTIILVGKYEVKETDMSGSILLKWIFKELECECDDIILPTQDRFQGRVL